MAQPQVISTLSLKRAEIAGYIRECEHKLVRLRAALANVDATIRLFDPEADPGAIRPKRPCRRRTEYFERRELPRLTLDVLRLATGTLAVKEIAFAVMRAKQMPSDDPALLDVVSGRVVMTLRALSKQGHVAKIGTARGARWSISPDLFDIHAAT
jgi:hypothetical protein